MTDPIERESHYIQSLERGLSVITVFGPERQEMTLSDVARAANLTRAAARRFLLTLVDLGYMRFDGKLFRLAPKALSLGYAYLSSQSLHGIAEPHLQDLVTQTKESSSMSVLDGHDIIYVVRVPTSRIMAVSINVGTRFPAYATSMGRVLLAGLDSDGLSEYLAGVELQPLTPYTVTDVDELTGLLEQVRSVGYSLVDNELERGLRSLAVPVHNKQGHTIAAVNVSSHVSRVTKDKAKRQFLPLLQEAAQRIEQDLSKASR